MKLILKYKGSIIALSVIVILCGLIYLGMRVYSLKNPKVYPKVYSGTAMNTPIKKTLYIKNDEEGTKIDKKIDDILIDVDNQLSVRNVDSEVSRCNNNYIKNYTYTLSEDIVRYLQEEVEICKESNGAFSPCIRPLSRLWGIEDGKNEIPSEEDIEKVLKNTNPMNLEMKEDGVVFHAEGMQIDFGATGKGIACDKLFELFEKEQLSGAVVSIGGNIAVYGDKGKKDTWHIGIQDPRGKTGEYMGIIDLYGNKVISTSGDYEKFFEIDGKRYHHIFNPKTGTPVENELMAVTIISDRGIFADALSTTCFVLGLEEGMEYAKEKEVEAIFVTKTKKVYITDGLKRKFRIQGDDYKIEDYENKDKKR